MTDREKVVVMAYTGIAMVQGDKLDLFYEYLAELFGRPVYSHEIPDLADEIKERSKPEFLRICAGEDPEDRRGEVMDEYKALDVENNVKVAVKKLREAYWSNDPGSYASQFCEAKQIIISAICFLDYTLQKEGNEKR